MPLVNISDTALYLLIGVLVALALILLLVGLARFVNDFTGELRYLNGEIRRTAGEERKRWLRRRRRLWRSLIPFIK